MRAAYTSALLARRFQTQAQSLSNAPPLAPALGSRLLQLAQGQGLTSNPGLRAGFSDSAASQAEHAPVYLVFGATGGIGAALSHRLAALGGAKTSLPGLVPPSALILSAEHDDKLKDLQGQLKGSFPIDVFSADATNPDAVDKVVQEVISRHGRLDGVANCIGNVIARSTLATDVQQLQDTLQVNLFTSFNIIKSSIKAMLAEESQQQHTVASNGGKGGNATRRAGGGGSIVLVSAALASHGMPNYEAMSAAKAAVEGLARSAAASYAQHNIRINCVAPGLTKTPQTKKFTDNKNVSGASQQMHPLKELAEPPEIAAALEFFLRPENDFITGQVLAVDGGLSNLHPHHAQDYGV
eukprot:GHRR01006810.1.p1 GENE.GHRR01006810.1~~GHRR01006810.1.p1  ORF type:complete len:354 (+),score=136.51 GHRR01006810.1:213-1274(+)